MENVSFFKPTSAKELIIHLKLDFLIPISFEPDVVEPLIFQTIISVTPNSESLKYQRFTVRQMD